MEYLGKKATKCYLTMWTRPKKRLPRISFERDSNGGKYLGQESFKLGVKDNGRNMELVLVIMVI